MPNYLLNRSGEDESIEVQFSKAEEHGEGRWSVHIGDHQLDLSIESNGKHAGLLRSAQKLYRFHVAVDQESIEVWLNGRRYDLVRAQRQSRHVAGSSPAAVLDQLVASMPGTVLDILLKPGDVFAARQPIIVMESMKMEMTLTASHPGVVKSIHCKVGQLVEQGATLARLAPEEDDHGAS